MVSMAAALFILGLLEEEEERGQCRERIDAFELSDEDFVKSFRLSKRLVRYLCSVLQHDLKPKSAVKSALSVELQILCTLRFLATGLYQQDLGADDLLMLSQKSVSTCIKKVCTAMNKHVLQKWVHFPVNKEKQKHIMETIHEKFGMPGVIGVIDCMPVDITAQICRNYDALEPRPKPYMNVQLVCDNDLKIINVNARFPGSMEDSLILQASQLGQFLEEHCPENAWLIGDSEYVQKQYVMTPLCYPRGISEVNYNRSHERTRTLIERCIRLLKSRFRCLSCQRALNYNPTAVGSIVNTCVALHNMCIQEKIELILADDEPELPQEKEQENNGMEYDSDDEYFEEGLFVRQRLIDSRF